MRLTADIITPTILVCNEEYSIFYCLRDLMKVFPQIIVFDTGSEDDTVSIIKETAKDCPQCKMLLIEERYSGDAKRIGQARNIMRDLCRTHFAFTVDSDEIWRIPQLQRMLEYEVPDDTEVVMIGARQVQDVNGKLMLRSNDLANRDGLVSPAVRWGKIEYPFEGHDLTARLARGVVFYISALEVYEYHMRHTVRSSKDAETYARMGKLGYFPYDGPFEEMPEGWLGEIDTRFPNPYILPELA
jgi:glycosyltransferase involved in cell wall biosynthesis